MPTSNHSKPAPSQEASVLDSIRRLSRGLRLAAQETQSQAGVSAAQLFVLRSLEDGSEASVSELAERTMTDRSSVASVVERLIQTKLVSRVTSRTDRRRAAITITAKGRGVIRKAPPAPTMMLLDALHTLPQKELKSLASGLSALISAMGLEKGPAYMLFEDGKNGKRKTSRS